MSEGAWCPQEGAACSSFLHAIDNRMPDTPGKEMASLPLCCYPGCWWAPSPFPSFQPSSISPLSSCAKYPCCHVGEVILPTSFCPNGASALPYWDALQNTLRLQSLSRAEGWGVKELLYVHAQTLKRAAGVGLCCSPLFARQSPMHCSISCHSEKAVEEMRIKNACICETSPRWQASPVSGVSRSWKVFVCVPASLWQTGAMSLGARHPQVAVTKRWQRIQWKAARCARLHRGRWAGLGQQWQKPDKKTAVCPFCSVFTSSVGQPKWA